ncbi:Protein halfway [Sarcoptes scabiei]|uniref:Protein halfway n=1 Tax=Sarcoptes scabiei TaxID=52283 RepID=A0A834R367_SARSC|nr:Protein halfway [Sarcoptes scabiei]
MIHLTILFQTIVIIIICVVGGKESLNLTEDLIKSLDQKSITSLNGTDWLCLSSSHSDVKLVRPNEIAQCLCLMNLQCTKLVNDENLSKIEPKIWLRCHNIQHEANVLKEIFEAIPNRWISLFDQDAIKCFENRDEDSGEQRETKLRLDFVRSNQTIILKYIEQIDRSFSYHLDSLSIVESNLETIPFWLMNRFHQLTYLNLTSNQLRDFNFPPIDINFRESSQLAIVDLSHNHIENVNLHSFRSLLSIDLSNNSLTTLSKESLPEKFVEQFEKIKKIDHRNILDLNIGNNPWNCDEKIDWLINSITDIVEINGNSYFHEPDDNRFGHSQRKLELFQTNEPECNLPLRGKYFPFSVWKSIKETLLCEQCDCSLMRQYARIGFRYVTVNCSNRNLFSVPTKLPKNTKILDLSNNQIRNLSALSKSHGQSPKWRHVSQIILSNNSLEALDGLDFIRSIVYLDISGNLLTEIPYYIINKVLSDKIDKFRMGLNPYVCDCNTVKMQKWMQNNYRIILDIKHVRCGNLRDELSQNESHNPIVVQAQQSEFLGREILHINAAHLCPSGDHLDALDILNIVLLISIVLLLLKVLYDFCWQKRTGKLPKFFKLNI